MLSDFLLKNLIDLRALVINRVEGDNLVFNIDYKIMQIRHPELINYFIKQELDPEAYADYEQGKIAYVILNNGRLEWKLTILGKQML